MLFSSFGVAFGADASPVSDIKGHWAEAQISSWIDKGLIKGYDDGSFKPENKITRAEFIALINRTFGFTEQATISFSDVAPDNWAFAEVAKAVKASYITGYADGTIGAKKPISRQEVAVIVDRLLGPTKMGKAESTFSDSALIALWAKDAVGAAAAKGILKGYTDDNSFKPSKSITRAEAVITLDRALTVQTTSASTVVYDKAGTYGPATGIETVNNNVVVNVAGVTLQNMVINGDLLLGKGIGEGDAFLGNVKVTGKVTVQGGGENSIHFNNSVLVDIVIDKKLGTGIVRIVSEGTTTVALVMINSPAILIEMNATGTGFRNVNIGSSLPTGSKVTLKGSFETVNVSSQQIQIDVPEGTIQNVNVNSTATGMSLNLSQGATINWLVLDAVVKILGKGTIVLATINTGGTTFETPPKTTTPETPSPTTPGPTTPGPTTPNPPQEIVVNKTALTTAIADATTLFGAHAVGAVNGNVSQETHDTFNNAITAAAAIKEGASSTQAQVNEAVTTLASATTAFKGAIIVIITTALTTAIADATTLLEAHPVGETSGNVSEAAYEAYENAIGVATAVRNAASSSQVQVDDALNTLTEATIVFKGAFVVLNISSLAAALTDATALLKAHGVGEANGNVLQTAYDTYKTAIASATVVGNAASSTQAEVDAAIETLVEATTVFIGAFIVVNISILAIALIDTSALLEAHPVGEANGNVSQTAYDTYKDAIEAATTVGNAASSTQAEVDGAIETLAEATTVFNGAFVVVNVSVLAIALTDATALLEAHPVGEASGNVSQTAYNAYENAIAIATAARNAASSTKQDIDTAVTVLAEATTVFSSAVVTQNPSIAIDNSLSNYLPLISITNLINGTNHITVYDGSVAIGSVTSSNTTVAIAVNALTPGVHKLKIKSVNQDRGITVYSEEVNYTVNAITILPQNQISESQGHVAVLHKSGQVYTWGGNYGGQIGDGTQTDHPTVFEVPNLPQNIIDVQAGEGHTTVLTSEGLIYYWGYYNNMNPTLVAGIDHVVSITSQGQSIYALKSDGTVWKIANYSTTITKVDNLDNVVAIQDAWSDTVVVLKSNGEVWAWGTNDNGQLGDGTTVNRTTPALVSGLPKIVEIKNGNQHTVALSVTGDVYAWGYNFKGQVGNGTTATQLVPFKIEGLSNIGIIGTGNYYSFAIDTDGKVYSWGYNNFGTLGLGNTTDSSSPQLITSNLKDVLAITGGLGGTAIALTSTGELWIWGSGTLLGEVNNVYTRNSPALMTGLNLFEPIP